MSQANQNQESAAHPPFWAFWFANLRKPRNKDEITLSLEQTSQMRITMALKFLHVTRLLTWIEMHDQEATLPFLVAKIRPENQNKEVDLVLRSWMEVSTIIQELLEDGHYRWLSSNRLPKAQPTVDQDATLVGVERASADYIFIEHGEHYKVYFKKNPWSSHEEWYVLIEILELYRLQRRDTIELHLFSLAEEFLMQQCAAARKAYPVDFSDERPDGFRGRGLALANELQVNEREFLEQLDNAIKEYLPKVVKDWLAKQGPVEYDPEKILVDPSTQTTWHLQYDDEGQFSHYKINMWTTGK